jgi:hypothetical protein
LWDGSILIEAGGGVGEKIEGLIKKGDNTCNVNAKNNQKKKKKKKKRKEKKIKKKKKKKNKKK